MRILIELFALIFALLVIYRRIIEPFFDGMKSKKPPHPSPFSDQSPKHISSVDTKKIQDAEFEEIPN